MATPTPPTGASTPDAPAAVEHHDSHGDNHGQTPAAWTAVILIMIAFVVGALGVVLAQWWLFWVGVGIGVLGLVAGKVMQMMGLGAQPRSEH